MCMASPPRALDPTNEYDRTGPGATATKKALDPLKLASSGGGTPADPLKLRGGGSGGTAPSGRISAPNINIGSPRTGMQM